MKCFYHNDLDGRCAGSIVAQYTGNYNKDDYFEVDYVMELPLDKIAVGEEVWFVDYSFKDNTKWVLDKLTEDKKCIVNWIDHHTSSINLLKAYPDMFDNHNLNIFVYDRISGAGLTYMYCYDKDFDDAPYYVKLVSDYDCWQYKYEPETIYFKIGMESGSFDALDDVWRKLSSNLEHGDYYNQILFDLTDRGRIIKSYIDQDNTYYRDHFAYESEICGYKCLVVNKKSNSWIFGDRYNDYDLVMVWVFDGTKYTYSIFSSNPNIDCSEIASIYGGGGHKGASGFSSTALLFRKVDK